MKFANRSELASKIEWEGGLLESLDYGITTEMMPEGDTELIEAWKRLETAFKAVQPLAEMVEGLLEDAGDDEDEDGPS